MQVPRKSECWAITQPERREISPASICLGGTGQDSHMDKQCDVQDPMEP
jgi:hypothetical protein